MRGGICGRTGRESGAGRQCDRCEGEPTPAPTIHTLHIDRWRPALANELVGRHWSRVARLKATDRQMVATYARLHAIPRATGRRRVSLAISGPWRGRTPDPDGCWKSLLDALVAAGLLLDDTAARVEQGPVQFGRARHFETTIELEDLP